MDELKRALNQCITVSVLFLSLYIVVYRTGVSGDDFWQVAKTGGGSAGVHFGKQPTQVFGRPCRSTQRVIALRRNF